MLEAGLRTLFAIFRDGLPVQRTAYCSARRRPVWRRHVPLLDRLDWGERAVAILLDRLIWIARLAASGRGSTTARWTWKTWAASMRDCWSRNPASRRNQWSVSAAARWRRSSGRRPNRRTSSRANFTCAPDGPQGHRFVLHAARIRSLPGARDAGPEDRRPQPTGRPASRPPVDAEDRRSRHGQRPFSGRGLPAFGRGFADRLPPLRRTRPARPHRRVA